MKRVPVSSSHVVSIGYDAASCELEVEFRSNGRPNVVGRYIGVPAELHKELMASASVGAFLHARIKPAFKWKPPVVETEGI